MVESSYEVQIILNVSRITENLTWYQNVITRMGNHAFSVVLDKEPFTTVPGTYKKMADSAEGAYFIVLNPGDDISSNLAEVFTKGYIQCYNMETYMVTKVFHDETFGAFRNYKRVTDSEVTKFLYTIDLKSKYDCFPFEFGGTIIRTEALRKYDIRESLGLETERDFLCCV